MANSSVSSASSGGGGAATGDRTPLANIFTFAAPGLPLAALLLTFAVYLPHVEDEEEAAPEQHAAPPTAGALGIVRSFAAYWLTMLAAGLYIFCALLAVQGIAAQ